MSTGNIQTLSGNGNTSGVDVIGPAFVSIIGTFGGGTATIQRQDAAGTWRDLTNGSFSADADKKIDFPPGSENTLRISLTGATTPSLTISIQGTGFRF